MSRVILAAGAISLLALFVVGGYWLGSALAQDVPKAPLEPAGAKAPIPGQLKPVTGDREKPRPIQDPEALRLLKMRQAQLWQGGQMVVEEQDIYVLMGPNLYRFDRELNLVRKVDLRKLYTEEELAEIEAKKAAAVRKKLEGAAP